LIRRSSEKDRRRVVIEVSPGAAEDVRRCEAAILNAFVDLVERIGPETAATWSEVLERVKTVLDERPVYRKPVQVAGRRNVYSIAAPETDRWPVNGGVTE